MKGENEAKNKIFNLKTISILTLVLVVIGFSLVGATLSRYITENPAYFEEKTEGGSIIHDHLDFTVNSVFEVRNQEELFAAINQGYAFIRLADDIENPLIVTQKAETLDSDLILDLNGIEIQRNGHDPILNIKQGVRLTVVDTSDEGTGGLYNPVGSVFYINGGTLTIATGHFESGPRYSEYSSYNNNIISTSNNARKTVIEDIEKVHYHSFVSDADGFSDPVSINAPIIKSYPQKTGGVVYTHGNLYFDHTYSANGSDITIKPDTYCYYRTSNDAINENKEMAQLTCDWYYTYWVDENYDYLCAEEDELASHGHTVDTAIEIAIYGYEDVIYEASLINETKNYYAAIQMTSGNLEVQNGSFFSYFGLENTACVNSTGGTINVVNGSFSSRIPNADSQVTNNNLGTTPDLMAQEDDTDAFTKANYFNRYLWNTAEARGALAMRGRSYCILNTGNAVLKIDNGSFYSSNNNTIHMDGGTLTVGGGSFAKQQNYKNITDAPVAIGDKTACIYMSQGNLNIGAAEYRIDGQYNIGIYMLDGELSVTDADIYIDGADTIGILMTNGNLGINVADFDITGDRSKGVQITNGTLHITSGDFEVYGAQAKGVEMADGDFTVETGAFTVEGKSCYGIQMLNGNLDIDNGSFTLSGDSSRGIYMANGQFNLANSILSLKGYGAMGVYSTVAGIGKFNITDTDFSLGDLDTPSDLGTGRQVGVYAENGQVKLLATDPANDPCSITVWSHDSTGIYALNGGSVDSVGYSYRLTEDNSTGIYSSGGSVDMDGGNVTLDGNLNCHGIYAVSIGDTGFHVNLENANISVGAGKGLKAASQTYRACTGVTMMTNGLENDTSNVTLTNTSITSHEIGASLCGGSLTFNGTGAINTSYASAVAVAEGDITFSEGSNYYITSHCTRTNSATNSYTIQLPLTFDLVTANRYQDYQNTDGIYVSGGSVIAKGHIDITHTGLMNGSRDAVQNFTSLIVTSYAIRVVGGNVTMIDGNILANAGGGVCCSKKEGSDAESNITMGTEEKPAGADITIHTDGEQYTSNSWVEVWGEAEGPTTWRNRINETGGHAIELNGGNIDVYYGTYTADFGNGIAALGSGNINVYNGEFNGWMTTDNVGASLNNKSGPAAYYGLKVMGSAVVNIFGGTFNGGNGGAMVTGVETFGGLYSNPNIAEEDYAEVYIYAGTFGSLGTGTEDAFNVYDAAKVIFGAYESSGKYACPYTTAEEHRNAIKMLADNASIATNSATNGSGWIIGSIVEIYYGSYRGVVSGDKTWGIYNGNAQFVAHNNSDSNDALDYVDVLVKYGSIQYSGKTEYHYKDD